MANAHDRELEISLQETLPSSVVLSCYKEIPSSMDQARQEISTLAQDKTLLVVAQSQNAGRGREDRSWASAAGGFYATYGVKVPRGSAVSGLSLVVGLALREVVAALGVPTFLKWPNDLLTTEDKKLAGILIELVHDAAGEIVILIGIGVNLRASATPHQGATSIETEAGMPCSVAEFAIRLTPVLKAKLGHFFAIAHMNEEPFKAFQDEYEDHLAWRGAQITIVARDQVELRGSVVGVAGDGALVIENHELEGKRHTVYAGDVVRVRKNNAV